MIRKNIARVLLAFALCSTSFVAATEVGVVSFSDCITTSKLGQAEQANFENLKKQLSSHLESTEKELKELVAKLNDPEHMDGLSPEAEAELKEKVQSLNGEMMRYQNQFYQVLNQANGEIIRRISTQISLAAEDVAKTAKLDLILNQEACFYRTDAIDVTGLVIKVMDENYEKDAKSENKGA